MRATFADATVCNLDIGVSEYFQRDQHELHLLPAVSLNQEIGSLHDSIVTDTNSMISEDRGIQRKHWILGFVERDRHVSRRLSLLSCLVVLIPDHGYVLCDIHE
jgi:hypothetical protein